MQQRVATLRSRTAEPRARIPWQRPKSESDARPAWELMSEYHLAKAAEILGTYLSQGSVDGHFDIREQLEAQFDRAVAAAGEAN